MQEFRLGDNLIRLRNERKMTQEEVAAFVGVTKAAVSKWEKRQSMPDIVLLPKLAALFDVTVDALLGYQAQLDEKEIKKYLKILSESFKREGFSLTFLKVREYAREYYNCYPFLLNLAVLILSYAELAEEGEKKASLKEACGWCEHVIKDCDDRELCQNASALLTLIDYCLGHYENVIETLKVREGLIRMSDSGDLLMIRSYLMLGKRSEAGLYADTMLERSLLNILESQILIMSAGIKEEKSFHLVLDRVEKLVENFDLNTLHPYEIMQFYYHAAVGLMSFGRCEQALSYLERYLEQGLVFMDHPAKLSFDSYLNRIALWTEADEMDFGLMKEALLSEMESVLLSVVFDPIKEEEIYKEIQKRLGRKKKEYKRK